MSVVQHARCPRPLYFEADTVAGALELVAENVSGLAVSIELAASSDERETLVSMLVDLVKEQGVRLRALKAQLDAAVEAASAAAS
jgi:hypothetical protein